MLPAETESGTKERRPAFKHKKQLVVVVAAGVFVEDNWKAHKHEGIMPPRQNEKTPTVEKKETERE